jgi:hypothetical protein
MDGPILATLLLGAIAGLFVAAGGAPARRVRPALCAGRWYAGDPARLREEVDRFLARAPAREVPGHVAAVVVPHAGHMWSGAVAGAGFASVRGKLYERVVLVGPSHRGGFPGVVVPRYDACATPLGEIPLDAEGCEALRGSRGCLDIPGVDADEHSLEVELPFLQRALGTFRLVPVLVGSPPRTAEDSIASEIGGLLDERTLLVVSSDFTHYGEDYDFFPFPRGTTEETAERLRAFDEGALSPILRRDAAAFADYRRHSGINACGARGIAIALRALPSGFSGTLLDYQTSGGISGDFSSSVSYAAIALSGWRPLLSRVEERAALEIARAAVRAAVRGEPLPPLPADVPAGLRRPGSAFVTVRLGGDLRGCMGSITGDTPLGHTIAQSAASAVRDDDRFEKVTAEQLPNLRLEVSVLGPRRPLERPAELRVGEEGVVLRAEGASGLLLPQVASERGWDVETFLAALSRKAGLAPDAWRSARLERFDAHVFGEAG